MASSETARSSRHASAGRPPAELLGISPAKLPAEVSSRYVHALQESRSERRKRAQKAYEDFGGPGRDPRPAGSVLRSLAVSQDWVPHLKTAALSTRWADIVGSAMADNSRVESFRDGEIVIRVFTTAWLVSMRYLMPHLEKAIRDYLAPVPVMKISLRGPNQYTFRHGRRTVPGRGPRDTWG